jgi:hypothetical protein
MRLSSCKKPFQIQRLIDDDYHRTGWIECETRWTATEHCGPNQTCGADTTTPPNKPSIKLPTEGNFDGQRTHLPEESKQSQSKNDDLRGMMNLLGVDFRRLWPNATRALPEHELGQYGSIGQDRPPNFYAFFFADIIFLISA